MKIEDLGDAELISKLDDLCARERVAMADLLEHLAEVDARKLHLARACSSIIGYCIEVLHFSEHQAWERVTAARALRKFPAILVMLREGALHLSGLAILAAHLDEKNHAELLARARFQSKRKIEEMLAMRAPKPEQPDRIRPVAPPKQKVEPIGPAQRVPFMNLEPKPTHPATPAEQRHVITFTASDRVKQKLDRARALASHRAPSQRLEDVFELALDALVSKLEREREGAAAKPRPQPTQASHSRLVPRAVRREVYARDGHQCTFTADGRRCSARSFLELHHIEAFALGGATTTSNVTLRCRAHNAYEGERMFGPAP